MLTRQQYLANSEAEYDPSIDYKERHLSWLLCNDKFVYVKTYSPPNEQISELDSWTQIYRDHPEISNHSAFIHYIDYTTKTTRNALRRKHEAEMVSRVLAVTPTTNRWFVTIGFDREYYRDVTAIDCINKLFTNYDWIHSAEGVMEFFTETGWRPHFMMEVVIPAEYKTRRGKVEKMTKSLVIRYIGKSAGFRTTHLIGPTDKDVDVKAYQDYHQDYLQLDKADNKAEYLRQDAEYREKNGIPAVFRK